MESKKELSKEEKEEIIAEAIVTVAGIMRLNEVPDQYMMAMMDAYQAGAKNTLARLMAEEKHDKKTTK